MQANPALRGCRYIALTGYDTPALIEQTVIAGFEAHLVKPVAIPKLLTTMAELCERFVGNG